MVRHFGETGIVDWGRRMSNSKNCLIVADAIEHSLSFQQDKYAQDCYTPACVAGQTVRLLDPGFIEFTGNSFYLTAVYPDENYLSMTCIRTASIKENARILLDLTIKEAYELFDSHPLGEIGFIAFDEDPLDPQKGEMKYFKTLVTNQDAAKVLRNVAETGEVDWGILQK